MDALTGVLVIGLLVVIGIVAYRVLSAPGGLDMIRRTRRLIQGSGLTTHDAPRQPTLETLRPGDAVSFWDRDDEVVESVIECREELGGRTSTWRWMLLTERLLEVAPDENALYDRATLLHQGSEGFYALTADPADGGALKTFEARVRDETIARDPVSVVVDGTEWSVESTGTFMARFVGMPTRKEVWRDISENPADNVYFELRRPASDSGGDEMALGIWTTHILVLQGRPLADSDIENLYPGEEEERPT